MAGRPTKLTPKVVDTLCEKLALGMTYTGACGAARINLATFNRWRDTGNKLQDEIDANPARQLTIDEEHLVDFAKRIAAAEAQIEEDFTTMIYNDAGRDVASAWKWLSLRRQDYKASQNLEVSGPRGGPIETRDVGGLTEDQRLARLAALLDAARARRDGQAAGDDAG